MYAEVAASRLFWALGFGADRMYPVRVVCRGCPSNIQGTDIASIQRKMPGKEIETATGSGWAWPELDLVDPTTDGAPRAERGALKLLAVFIQHTDSKPEQQRLICVSQREKRQDGEPCAETFMMVHDLALRGGIFFSPARWGAGYFWGGAPPPSCRGGPPVPPPPPVVLGVWLKIPFYRGRGPVLWGAFSSLLLTPPPRSLRCRPGHQPVDGREPLSGRDDDRAVGRCVQAEAERNREPYLSRIALFVNGPLHVPRLCGVLRACDLNQGCALRIARRDSDAFARVFGHKLRALRHRSQ